MGLDTYFFKANLEEVGYFRKFNFLVAYVKNYIDEDYKNSSYVIFTERNIEDLKLKCLQVLDNHSLAEELLPTTKGFFFGPTDYDEYYFEDVSKVLDWLNSLKLTEKECLFIYHNW